MRYRKRLGGVVGGSGGIHVQTPDGGVLVCWRKLGFGRGWGGGC